jgi:hypothetical protein
VPRGTPLAVKVVKADPVEKFARFERPGAEPI